MATILILAAPMFLQTVFGDEFRSLVTNLSNDPSSSSDPAIATRADRIHTVWVDNNDEIIFRRSLDAGLTFLAPVNLSNSPGVESTDPSIAAAIGNFVHVTWMEFVGPSHYDLYYARSDDNGGNFFPPVNLTPGSLGAVDISVAADGSNLYIAYTNFEVPFAQNIGLLRSADGGANFFPPTYFDLRYTSGDAPAVHALGSIVSLLWSASANQGFTTDILYKRSSDSGASFVEPASLGGAITGTYHQITLNDATLAAFGETIDVVNSGLDTGIKVGKYTILQDITTDVPTAVTVAGPPSFPTTPSVPVFFEVASSSVTQTSATSFTVMTEVYFNATGQISGASMGNVTIPLTLSPAATITGIVTTATSESAVDISPGDPIDQNPDIAFSTSTGELLATWTSGTATTMFTRTSGASGFLTPVALEADDSDTNPSVASVGTDVTVAWERQMGADKEIAYRLSEDSGVTFGGGLSPPPLLTSSSGITSISPDVARGGAGISAATYIVWQEDEDIVLKSTAPLISLTLSDLDPKWDVDEVTASGIANAEAGDTITLDWGDGTIITGIPIATDSTWGPISHTYSVTALGPRNLKADLVDSLSTIRNSVNGGLTVLGHDTTFVMNDIGSPAADTPLTVSGFAIDKDTGQQLPSGQPVTFFGSGASGLAPVLTGGIGISDIMGVTIESCSSCIPDIEGSAENVLMRMHVNAELTFQPNTQSVMLAIQDTGTEVMTFKVTEFGNPTPFEVESFGSAPDQVNLLVSAPSGIQKMKLTSITGTGSTVGISSIVTSNPAYTPQELIVADLENLAPGTYGAMELESGSFSASTRTIDNPGLMLDVTASLALDPDLPSAYIPSVSDVLTYEVAERTWGAAGEPTSFTVDSGTGVSTIKCATDADGDGLCSNWEGTTGQISYSGALYSLCDFECSVGDNHMDMYVEMDYYVGHQPLQGAIDDVVDAFAAVPNSDLPGGGNPNGAPGITLHVLVDEDLPHAHNLIQVWADPNGSPDSIEDDFEDIKAKHFGTQSEWQSGGLLAVNNALKAKAQAYHYGVWVHGIGGTCGASTPSGIAEAPGNDFMVSLGCGFTETDGTHAGSEGDRNEQAGTLMHELGHNSNLNHGGPKEFRQLPGGNNLSGAPAYAVTDAGGNDNSRAFTITGIDVITSQVRDGTVIIPVNVAFTATPGTVTVSSVSWSGQGANLIINTVSSFVSGTGNSRIVTLAVDYKTTAASTATTGDMGTLVIGLNIGNTGPTLNTPTTLASGARMKIDVSTTDSGMNCKVNYRSVMSYTRQFDTYLGANYVLDFSRSALDLVDEALSNAEGNFFGGPAGVKLVNAYPSGGVRAYKVSTTPDVDWNGNGAISGSSIQDSNHFGITGCGASANQKQRGYDDWVNVQLDFKEGIGSFDGNFPDPRAILEITPEVIAEQQIQVDESTATTTANPPGGSHSGVVEVTLQSDEPATIYYTTDGSEPTESSRSAPSPVLLIISSDTTLKFFSISDASGNPEGVTAEVYDFPDDTTPPEITVVGDIEDGEHFATGTVPPEPTCTAIDTGTGVNEDGCVITGYSTADGAHTLVATAEDNAGNVATVEIHYSVGPLTLLGFYSPTDNPPTINVVKAGKVVPLKFEVFAGATELTDVDIVDTVRQFKVSCDADAPTDIVEETIASPGGTVLRYDESVGQFVYNWKAPNAKACYDVVLTLDDGTTLTAKFKTT